MKTLRVRVHSAALLLHLRKKLDLVLMTLTEALNDSQTEVKIAAIGVLIQMGSAAQSASNRLMELTKDRNEEVRRAATEALKKIGPVVNP